MQRQIRAGKKNDVEREKRNSFGPHRSHNS
jgi:hypothetical protein